SAFIGVQDAAPRNDVPRSPGAPWRRPADGAVVRGAGARSHGGSSGRTASQRRRFSAARGRTSRPIVPGRFAATGSEQADPHADHGEDVVLELVVPVLALGLEAADVVADLRRDREGSEADFEAGAQVDGEVRAVGRERVTDGAAQRLAVEL